MTPSTPLLVVIAGPGRGQSVPLQGSLSIGRDEQNVLPIADRGLSRHHCVIEVNGSQLLKDLGSKNGVFVNGLPVTERSLADGDQIRVGDSALVAMIPGRSVASDGGHSVILDKTPVPISSTIAIDAASCRYLDLDQAGTRGSGRATKDLEVLFPTQRSASVHLDDQGSRLGLSCYSHTRSRLRAPGAAILATPSGDDALAIVDAKTANDQPLTVCAAIAAQALADRARVLAGDIPALSVPLLGSDGARSVLCLTARSGGAGFSKEDLRLLGAIGSIGGLALERINHLEWLHGENARLRQDAAIEHNLVGESVPMQAVYRFISRVAATDTTVLLRGKAGRRKRTGRARDPREQQPRARTVRRHQLRRTARGAARKSALRTRARSVYGRHHPAAWASRAGGSRHGLSRRDRRVAPPLQAKLLRVLQDQIVERVGARRGIPIDVRVIAATNRDLEGHRAGTFREAVLPFEVVSLAMPPLRGGVRSAAARGVFRPQARGPLQADGEGDLARGARAAHGL